MEWCREKGVRIAFVGEAWIKKNDTVIQTHLSFVLISTEKKRRRVMVHVRKGIEEQVKVVKEEDNLVILQEKKKKKIGRVYTNRR